MKKAVLLSTLLGLFPAVVFAQDPVGDLLVRFIFWIQTLIPIVVGLAVLYFFWGVAKFIRKSDDPAAVSEGKQQMLWGVVALFVIVTVWGLVAFVQDSLDIHETGSTTIPVPEL